MKMSQLAARLEKKHDVFGEQLSYLEIKDFTFVEKYVNTNHDTRALVKNAKGDLFLYDFHEEMGFPDDVIHEHLFPVESKEEAEKYKHSNIFTLKATFRKFIWIGPGFDVKAVNHTGTV